MLFRILEIRFGNTILIKILKALYSGTSATIRGTKNVFQTFVGCRQGGMESPVIFNIYLDFVLRCAEAAVLKKFPDTGLKYSYRIPGHCSNREQRLISGMNGIARMRMLLYADDIVLLSTNIVELQNIIEIYNETFIRFGLQISVEKTETMAFNVNEELMAAPSLFTLNDLPLKNVRVI